MLRVLASVLSFALLGAVTGCATLASSSTDTAPRPAASTGAPTVVTGTADDPPGPFAPGTPVEFGRWRWNVGAVAWNRTPEILAANAHAPQPPEGYGWAVVQISVRNIGGESATPAYFDVTLDAGGWSVGRRDIAASHVRLPHAFEPATLAPGESLSGDIGFWMPLRAHTDPTCLVHLDVSRSLQGPSTDFAFRCAG